MVCCWIFNTARLSQCQGYLSARPHPEGIPEHSHTSFAVAVAVAVAALNLPRCHVLHVLFCCGKTAEAEAVVSVNQKDWLVMHMHMQLKLEELRGPPNPWFTVT